MSDAAQASASSKSSWSTRSSLVRPTPNEIVRDTSLMIVPTRSSTALNGVSRRMAMFPQPMSKPSQSTPRGVAWQFQIARQSTQGQRAVEGMSDKDRDAGEQQFPK